MIKEDSLSERLCEVVSRIYRGNVARSAHVAEVIGFYGLPGKWDISKEDCLYHLIFLCIGL